MLKQTLFEQTMLTEIVLTEIVLQKIVLKPFWLKKMLKCSWWVEVRPTTDGRSAGGSKCWWWVDWLLATSGLVGAVADPPGLAMFWVVVFLAVRSPLLSGLRLSPRS